MNPDPLPALLLTAALIVFNAFFVATEFALVKVRQSQLALKVKEGNSSAKLAQHIVENIDKYLSATQLAITWAGLALGWIGQDAMGNLITSILQFFSINTDGNIVKTIAFPLAFWVLTFVQILIGELLPKCIAIENPLKYALLVAWPLKIFYTIFSPFIWLLQVSSKTLMRLIGINSIEGNEVHTEEEIKLLLTESEEGGAIAESSNELIQNVFEFDDRTVRQIYIPRSRIFAIDIEEDIEKSLPLMIEEGYSRVPMYEWSLDNIIGVIYLKDLLKATYSSKKPQLRNLIKSIYFVPQNQKIEQLLKDFQKRHLQMAIVTNEHGETAGIVTLEDIVEELVGEIHDEHDIEEEMVSEKRPGTYVIKAIANMSDVNDTLPSPLPESPDYDTISGFINTLFGRIPHAGEIIDTDDYLITVLKREKNTIELIKVQTKK